MFSGKVLVAEDVEGNQKLMELMLSKLGLEVTIAADGRQAVEKALSQSFDLILMDMQMPHMNGYDAATALKQRGYKTPIVALTANAMKGDDLKCLEAGCDDYLPKPVDRRELPRLLAKYLTCRQKATGISAASMSGASREIERSRSQQAVPQTPSNDSHKSNVRTVINWDRLLDKLGDEETIREIMPAYINDIKVHFEKLSQAVKAVDYAEIASHAHALKGVGRNLGVDPLTDMGYQMECAGREDDIESASLRFGRLSQEVQRVLEALTEHDWSGRNEAV